MWVDVDALLFPLLSSRVFCSTRLIPPCVLFVFLLFQYPHLDVFDSRSGKAGWFSQDWQP